MVVGEIIKQVRNGKPMSRRALSEASGVSESAIKQYESGVRQPRIEQLKMLATALEVDVNVFLNTGDLPSERRGDTIHEAYTRFGEHLKRLTPGQAVQLMSSLNNTLEQINRTASPESHEGYIQRLSKIVASYGRMIINSREMRATSAKDPEMYEIFTRNYQAAVGALSEHHFATLDVALMRAGYPDDLRKLIYQGGGTEDAPQENP